MTPAASDEELIHEIAVELNNDGAYCGNCDYEGGLSCSDCKRVCEGYARRVVLPRIKASHSRPVLDRELIYDAIEQAAERTDLAKFMEEDDTQAFADAVFALFPTEEANSGVTGPVMGPVGPRA
jgi:hypothetical protein